MSNKNITEDITQARIVYVTNFNRGEITETALREFFGNFGELIRTIIYEDRSLPVKSRKPSFALIIYKESQSVTRVLKKDVHTLNQKHLIVKLAPSWLQLESFEDKNLTVDDLPISNSNTSVLKLNFDCLLNMFSLLNFSDQVKLSELSGRFRDIAEQGFKRAKRIHFFEIQFDTPFEVKNIFKNVGKHTKYITFQGMPDRLFAHDDISIPLQLFTYFIPHVCPNLTTLQFNKTFVSYSLLKSLIPVLKDLESLVLRTCFLTDDIIIILQNCRKLKKLDLSMNWITGEGLETLSDTIMHLNLAFCTSIKKEHLTNLFKVAKFRQIKFPEIHRIDVNELSKVKSLEAISFHNTIDADLRPIASIPNLKNLFINCYDGDLDDTFFVVLEQEKSNVMEKLWLPCASMNGFRRKLICNFKNLKDLCVNADNKFLKELINKNVSLTSLNVCGSQTLSDSALLDFVNKSEHIKIIDITLCKQFNNSFVRKLLETLKNLNRKTSLKLIITKTEITCPSNLDGNYHLCKGSKLLLKLSESRETSALIGGYLFYGFGPGYHYVFSTDNIMGFDDS